MIAPVTSDPTKPGITPQKPIELVLAEQANDAMQQGTDPHAATDMLGTMLKHLKANPQTAQHANDALAAGIDPHAISGEIWRQSTAPATPPPPAKGVLQRAGDMLSQTASEFVQHPLDTTARMLTTPIKAGYEAAFAPGVGEARPDPRLSKGGNSSGAPINGPAYDAEHGAITPQQRTAAGLTAASTLAFPTLVGGASRRLAAAGANRFLANLGGTATGGFVAGAAANPNDPLAGGVAGGTMATALGGVAPPLAEFGRKGASSGITALGLRPTGLTAAEMAADAAALRAPVGPQAGAASATPTIDAAMRSTPPAAPGSTPLPTPLQQFRATTGKAVQGAGIESAKTLALREVAHRLDLDNVTSADAISYADRVGTKPLAVLDLGGGNVAGLARTAKDVPSLARRQIPDFLNGRSAGAFGDEGQTLQRVTGDIENRIGLKPEDYYKSLDDMVSEQKALSKPAYDKVRNTTVDDPEVLSLFDIPEFKFAHDAVARAERIRPNGAEIKPLSETTDVNGESVKVQNPQTLGTLDKMRQYVGDVARGKLESKAIDRNTARAMLERLDAVTSRMDELHPDYQAARQGYAGRAQAMDAYQAGKDEMMSLDPREIQAKLTKMPENQADLYRRGGYDAVRAKLLKMSDGANIGDFLEKNPDVRARVAALAKNPDDALALRGDLNVERHMGGRKSAILGGPNTAERLIEHESTKPLVTKAGDLIRSVPVLGKATGGLVDNAITRRTAGQTSDVMGEVGKIMTRSGPNGVRQTMNEIDAMRALDLQRRITRRTIANSVNGVASVQVNDRQ